MNCICGVTITLSLLHFTVGNFCRFLLLNVCIISRNIAACVFVRVSFWHRRSQSAGASTSHSHHLQCKDMFNMSWIKTLWQRERVGETTLIFAFQLPLPGILVAISHQANATVIQFVRLYRKYAKYITYARTGWLHAFCEDVVFFSLLSHFPWCKVNWTFCLLTWFPSCWHAVALRTILKLQSGFLKIYHTAQGSRCSEERCDSSQA